MDVVAFLVAHGQAAEAGHPGMSAFNDPTVAAEALAAVQALARDAGRDAALAALPPAAAAVVGLVGVQLLRSAAWARRH